MDPHWKSHGKHFESTQDTNDWGWDLIQGPSILKNSFRASSHIDVCDLDMWDKQNSLRTKSVGLCSTGMVLDAGHHSSISTSSLSKIGHANVEGIKRWQSTGRLVPEGAPRPHAHSQGAQLRALLESSSLRQGELVQRLREAHGRLDSQAELLRFESQTGGQHLELKHKRLAEAVSALEQEKRAAGLSLFEECRRNEELKDKVLKLEMDMQKMRSALERGKKADLTLSQSSSQLHRTLPITQNDFNKEEKKQTEKELKRVREALRESEDQAEALEAEKDQMLLKLQSSKESEMSVLNQIEQVNQKLSKSTQAQSELEDQLSDSRSCLGQIQLERDLLSAKVLRLEDSLEDMKTKLSAALSEKDCLFQEKADVHQRAEVLGLQLERAQRGREGFTEQVCELHSELARAKAEASKHNQDRLLMKDEVQATKELSEKLSSDLETSKDKLEVTLKQLHELEAEKVIHTNQITALEAERSILIGEKEELLRSVHHAEQEDAAGLKEEGLHLRESQTRLQQKHEELQTRCKDLEELCLQREAELGQKTGELRRMESGFTEEKEELKRVAAHWNDRWEEVALKLRSTQAELDGEKRQRQQDTSRFQEEGAELVKAADRLQTELQRSQVDILQLLQQRADSEAELSRIKEAGAMERVKLDACRQQLDLERNRSQTLQRKMMNGPVYPSSLNKHNTEENNTLYIQDDPQRIFLTDPSSLEGRTPSLFWLQVSLEEEGGERAQEQAEMKKLWDMLMLRSSELERQQQELQSARVQVSQNSSEVDRLQQQLTNKEKELMEKENALKCLEKLRDSERREKMNKIRVLEQKISELKEANVERKGNKKEETFHGDSESSDAHKTHLDESTRRAEQQKTKSLKDLHQNKEGRRQSHEATKERVLKPEAADHEHQRRLVTEQLKSLFKEQEQRSRGQTPDGSPGVHAKWIKNSVGTLGSKLKEDHERGSQQKEAGPGALQGTESPHLQEEEAKPRQELHSETVQMSSVREEISNLSKRNENLLKAKLRFQHQIQRLKLKVPLNRERTSSPSMLSSLSTKAGEEEIRMDCDDGSYLARQVMVCDSENEDEVVSEELDVISAMLEIGLGGQFE
ncbi:trichohyalin-like isoform X2 [Denticeps clupeoides]|uniref:trichohyalin-like isoform X2 n=1 Tax=Denticeps clupeoides TaxID=299321 RepID=UPI0010A58511|nr:trichohyalin-like isoform X2 [Denticeps clupeoides]